MWRVEGISAEFTKPRNPYGVSWYRLSSERENIHVSFWRNQIGCMIDFGEDSCILLGIACSLQGGEITHLVSAKGITKFTNGPFCHFDGPSLPTSTCRAAFVCEY